MCYMVLERSPPTLSDLKVTREAELPSPAGPGCEYRFPEVSIQIQALRRAARPTLLYNLRKTRA